jgi:hypothetical protein
MLAPAFLLRPVKLAATLTLGNALSLGSTLLLVGPSRQCAAMLERQRLGATALYLASILATLVAAFYVKSRALCLLCILAQYCALIWYSLSFIPWAQAALLRMLGRADPGDF